MDINNIIEKLKTNLTQYRPVPFWSWNGKLEKKQLIKQIDELKADGMGGYFMHARSGLKTEYLSDSWMQAIDDCGNYGEQVGMCSWIYDENGWPSGFAGGKLLEDVRNRDKYIEHTIGEFDSNADVNYILNDETIIRTDKKEDNTQYLNLFIKTAVSTVDICNKNVVNQFIELTHENYKRRFGDELPKKFKGFFTDEPQYQRWGTPYTNVLEDYFKEKFNEDILDKLGLLFVEKQGYRKFRYRYWKALQELMLSSFAESVYNWCEENHLQLTGHYVEESSLGFQMMCCAGVMPFYEFEHIPGIDWLGRKTDNELPVRQVSSVAAQLGKPQILTETFGCCGWDVTPTELRRILGFQFVGGVNLLCAHLIPYSEAGLRKHDFPAHYSHINLWVEKEFKIFNDFATRLGYLIAESEECVNVAVLHPLRSGYFDYKRGDIFNEEEFNIKPIDDTLRKDIRLLSSNGINYHFIDETILARHGRIEESKLCCGKCKYDYLILPHNLTMDVSTEQYLRMYAENGGKILILGDKPRFLEANEYDYPYLSSNCTFDEILNAQKYRIKNTDNELYYTYRHFDNTDFIFVQNASDCKKYTQEFILDSKYKSFKQLDFNTLEFRNVPLEVTFEPNECMLLFPDETEIEPQKPKQEIKFYLDNDQVEFDENILVVDNVRYSRDGEDYSKAYPVAGLFAKLLQDRYEGGIYFKYNFEVRKIPEEICITTEEMADADYFLNGQVLKFSNRSCKEQNQLVADVSELVKSGVNEFVVKTNWFQNENVYYALFGENVTESLKNCLVYDRELEPIYCIGRFGVYTDNRFVETSDGFTASKDFYIGETPRTVTEPVTDGLPFFSGTMKIKKKIILDKTDIILRIPGKKMTATVKLNGNYVGKVLFGELIDIGKNAVVGENILEIEFIFSNRNKFGPHHNTDTITHFFSAPDFFEMCDWEDGVCPGYTDNYELIKFGCAK